MAKPRRATKRNARRNSTRSVSMAQRTADREWLEHGGLDQPHTKAGIAAATRLQTNNSPHRAAIRRYLMAAPEKMAPTYGSPTKTSASVRTVQGGLPTLGNRR